MKKGQSALEYTVVIVIAVAALLAMQVYIKRAFQGKLRQAADEVGGQYAPKATTSDITIKMESTIKTNTETKKVGGEYVTTTTTNVESQTDTRKGYETVGALESSLY